MTVGKLATANAMNEYYGQKITRLREPLLDCLPAAKNTWPTKKLPFLFRFCNAGKVAKIVKGLGTTTAMGVDSIPMGVLKLSSDVLSGPISHIVNQSLASSRVPLQFKQGVVKPILRGNGKNRNDPASYRPVCVLNALSKVLKTTVKSDEDAHTAKMGTIPTIQHGFRAGRSCLTA
jgi:hypothetical protein